MSTVTQEALSYGPGREENAAQDRERLILEHLPYVEMIARRIHQRLPPHVSLDDLISVGVIGLISAIDNYRPEEGAQIKTYAGYKIRGAILDSLRACDWGSRHRRKKCRQIEQAIAAAEQRFGRVPTEEEIITELNITAEEYHAALYDLHALTLESLDQVAGRNSETELVNLIPDGGDNLPSRIVERRELEQMIAKVLEQIPALERTVLSLYYHEELTLEEISRVVGLHISRVSRLKTQAVLRLRAQIASRWPTDRGGIGV
jgi:RNA polymerase sigma factor for flagellar operon FliA